LASEKDTKGPKRGVAAQNGEQKQILKTEELAKRKAEESPDAEKISPAKVEKRTALIQLKKDQTTDSSASKGKTLTVFPGDEFRTKREIFHKDQNGNISRKTKGRMLGPRQDGGVELGGGRGGVITDEAFYQSRKRREEYSLKNEFRGWPDAVKSA